MRWIRFDETRLALVRGVGAAKRLKRRVKQRLRLFEPLQLLPYRGHGTAARLLVSGRLVERHGVIYDADAAEAARDATQARNSGLQNLRESVRRLRSDEIPDARIEVRLGAVRREVHTDGEGYFHLGLELDSPVGPGWHGVQLRLLESMAGREGLTATAQVLVPRDDADYGIISDIDDTVVHTGAANFLRMIHTVLFKDARARKPFPGVSEFYRALQRGPNGRSDNPIFYVSRSGWNLYDLFDAFFELQNMPKGPMFLTDLSLLEPKSTSLGMEEDKPSRIRKLLSMYPAMPFVLVGDSGQRDPEIYRMIAQESRDRIVAVYIRDVTGKRRDAQVQRILEDIRAVGVSAQAVRHTDEAARHAATLGLIRAETVGRVAEERREEEAAAPA